MYRFLFKFPASAEKVTLYYAARYYVPCLLYSCSASPQQTTESRLCRLLLSECNFSGYMVHSVYNRKRLQLITQISDNPAARLKSLFDSDTDSLYLSACRLYNLNQSLQSAAISEKIVDNQNTIPFTEKLFGYDDLIFVL